MVRLYRRCVGAAFKDFVSLSFLFFFSSAAIHQRWSRYLEEARREERKSWSRPGGELHVTVTRKSCSPCIITENKHVRFTEDEWTRNARAGQTVITERGKLAARTLLYFSARISIYRARGSATERFPPTNIIVGHLITAALLSEPGDALDPLVGH